MNEHFSLKEALENCKNTTPKEPRKDSEPPPLPYKPNSPAEAWDKQETKRSLDELFNATFAYRSSKNFHELMNFIKWFRSYSPYNGLLIHIQRPGARFVAPPYRWQKMYGRRVKPNATPIVILQPMGPVMFVFDVSDTEPGPDELPLPKEVERPFEVLSGCLGPKTLSETTENAKRDGIKILGQKAGSQSAGSIQKISDKSVDTLQFQSGRDKENNPIYHEIPVRYNLILNEGLSIEARYATFAHELAHLYCGHLGTPYKEWWPDRCGLSQKAEEFEAECVSFLVCSRIGIDSPSATYLSGYVKGNDKVPPISLECVMKAAGLIEQMGRKRQKPRKIPKNIKKDDNQ